MSDSEPQLDELDEQATAVIRGRVPMEQLADFFDRSFGQLAATISAQGIEIAGPAFALYQAPPSDVADIEVGFPVAGTVTDDGDVVASSLPGGPAATLVHAGSYDTLGASWQRLFEWATDAFFEPAGPVWEVYVTEPSPDMDPADLRTMLYLPGAQGG
jgi:effector-binding domain-containing protein